MDSLPSGSIGEAMPVPSSPAELSGVLFADLCRQARDLAAHEPWLSATLDQLVIGQSSFGQSLAAVLTRALSSSVAGSPNMLPMILDVVAGHPVIVGAAAADLSRLVTVNSACPDALTGLLSFVGFQSIQAYRVAHALWGDGRERMAVLMQNWAARTFAVDIHPAARIDAGVLFDHGIGVAIGSTAVVESDVVILHGVTLGSTLTSAGDRHPKVRRGVTIGAGATILGNIEIGAGAVVAAGSVVLATVPPATLVAGAPARVIGPAPDWLAVHLAVEC